MFCSAWQIIDGFQVHRATDIRESVAYLTILTRQLQQHYSVREKQTLQYSLIQCTWFPEVVRIVLSCDRKEFLGHKLCRFFWVSQGKTIRVFPWDTIAELNKPDAVSSLEPGNTLCTANAALAMEFGTFNEASVKNKVCMCVRCVCVCVCVCIVCVCVCALCVCVLCVCALCVCVCIVCVHCVCVCVVCVCMCVCVCVCVYVCVCCVCVCVCVLCVYCV